MNQLISTDFQHGVAAFKNSSADAIQKISFTDSRFPLIKQITAFIVRKCVCIGLGSITNAAHYISVLWIFLKVQIKIPKVLGSTDTGAFKHGVDCKLDNAAAKFPTGNAAGIMTQRTLILRVKIIGGKTGGYKQFSTLALFFFYKSVGEPTNFFGISRIHKLSAHIECDSRKVVIKLFYFGVA